MPIIESWLSDEGYQVSTVANRIQGAKGNIRLAVLLEDYAQGCSIRMLGPMEHVQSLRKYLDTLSTLDNQLTACAYCDTNYSTTEEKCPNCGAHRRKA